MVEQDNVKINLLGNGGKGGNSPSTQLESVKVPDEH